MAHYSELLVVFMIYNVAMASSIPINATTNKTNTNVAFKSQSTAPSGINVLISLVLKAKVHESTKLMLQKYSFINRPSHLIPAILRLGIRNTGIMDSRNMTTNDKFTVLYRQFLAFVDPMNFICDYEAVPWGSRNDGLSRSVNITRIYVHDTVYELHQILTNRNIPIPTVAKISEQMMENTVKYFLRLLQTKNLGVPPTNSNVKIYRNYVILDTLTTVIKTLQYLIPE